VPGPIYGFPSYTADGRKTRFPNRITDEEELRKIRNPYMRKGEGGPKKEAEEGDKKKKMKN